MFLSRNEKKYFSAKQSYPQYMFLSRNEKIYFSSKLSYIEFCNQWNSSIKQGKWELFSVGNVECLVQWIRHLTVYPWMGGLVPIAGSWVLAHLSRRFPGSCCDRSWFVNIVVVVGPSIHNFFKQRLLLNYWMDSNQNWQKCSLDGPLLKLVKELWLPQQQREGK